MKEQILLRDKRDGIVTLTLNQPEKRNALSARMIETMQRALDELQHDDDARVVVISGAGPGFCSGHDLREIRSADAEARKRLFEDCSRMMASIVRHSRPIIARVHGVATAAGCQLVASCDLAVASEAARFATPGVNIGLWCHTPQVAVSRNIAPKHAMEMLLTGDLIDAHTAERFGLVNCVVPAEDLDREVDRLASRILSKPSAAITDGKASFYEQLDLSLEEAYGLTAGIMSELAGGDDSKEGISAFLEKRSPRWRS
jgi:enoyl-CoA hydratase/carnithine racemase